MPPNSGPNPPKKPAFEWEDYFKAIAGLPPRETLVMAADRFDAERREDVASGQLLAIDLGCGDGRDTVELLRRGWRVIAMDSNEVGIRRLMERAEVDWMPRLEARVASYEDAPLVPADLINASFSIPHIEPSEFPKLWTKIASAIKPGGRFAGQFFGVNDSWAKSDDGITRTYHTRADVERMLREATLEAEHFDEVERDGKTAMGDAKYWHIFHIIARRPG